MKSILDKFRRGLRKTAVSISRNISGVFTDQTVWNEDTYEELEAALIAADFGVRPAMRVVNSIRDRYDQGLINTNADAAAVVRDDILSIFNRNVRSFEPGADKPTVILFVGVNGSGKTTTIGKLAKLWSDEGRKVVMAACDTFRAAAVEQLKLWGDRAECPVVASIQGADPSSVAFDAVSAAVARKADILLIDTAGRQQNQKGLMEELAKMRRTIAKVMPGAPHEVWLTIDASIGTNAISQVREFGKYAGLTGLALTKLDGTGKGGMAIAVEDEFEVPVIFAGFGESPEDLQPFDPVFYTDSLLAEIMPGTTGGGK